MSYPDFYRYPAIFTFAEDGVHITFPDLPGCVSFGEDEDTAVKMAHDALKLHLYGMEEDGDAIPAPSKIRELSSKANLSENEAFMVIEVFMPPYREKQSKRFVKKTLSLPYWLNAEAERAGINFSKILQNAIMRELHIFG